MSARQVLERLAAEMWGTMETAHSLGTRLGEETLTELLMLRAAQLGTVRVHPVSRTQEGATGVDWLWLASGQRGFAVQAKRLDCKELVYRYLQHRVRGSGERQIDLLSGFASRTNMEPVYCLFNWLPEVDASAWACSDPLDSPQLGISVAPLEVIQTALLKGGKRSFSAIHGSGGVLPWRCFEERQQGGPSHRYRGPGPGGDGRPEGDSTFRRTLADALDGLASGQPVPSRLFADIPADETPRYVLRTS